MRKLFPRAATGRRQKREALLGIPLVFVIAVALLLPPKVAVVSPAAMSLRDEAVGTGFVKAKVLVGVGAKINGVVLTLYVDQGDPVCKGQVLAELQNQDVQSQITQADSQVAAQRASLATAQANWQAAQACVGLGLLLTVLMAMSGIYRGLIGDATRVVDAVPTHLWVVQKDTRGPFAESSRIPEDVEFSIAGSRACGLRLRYLFSTFKLRRAENPFAFS